MADLVYNVFKRRIMDGGMDLDTNTIKAMLVTSTYTPNRDTHTIKSDVTNEVTGTAYTAGGVTLANKTVTQDDTDDEGVWDADDAVWAASTITARAMVIYIDTGTGSTSYLVCYFDFTTDKSSNNGEFRVAFNAEGIINLN